MAPDPIALVELAILMKYFSVHDSGIMLSNAFMPVWRLHKLFSWLSPLAANSLRGKIAAVTSEVSIQ